MIRDLTNLIKEMEIIRRTPRNLRITLPTGDGIAIGFYDSPEKPFRLAVQIQKVLKEYNSDKDKEKKIEVRIGLNSGFVFPIIDINDEENIAGNGISIANRVMSIGDAGHILASERFALYLIGLDEYYSKRCKYIGEYEVKPDLTIGVYNIYDDEVGNPSTPTCMRVRVSDIFNEVKLIRELIKNAKSVDLICSSSATFYDLYKDVIKESKPKTRIFLRKWTLGNDRQRQRVNWYRRRWEALNDGVAEPFLSVKLHKNDTFRGFIITHHDRTYGIFGAYIWVDSNHLKGDSMGIFVTDESKLGKYLIDVWRNRLNKMASDSYQAQLLLEDIYLKSDSMSPEFVEGTFLHNLRVHLKILELEPNASDALQIAGLAHDIDRAYKEKMAKQEDYPSYEEYKRQHAIRSAEIIGEILRNAKFDENVVRRVQDLVRNHEIGGDRESEILKAADSLVFFEYDVEAYLERSGEEATKKKIRFMYNRLSPEHKAMVKEIMKRASLKIRKLFEDACKESIK